MMDYGEILERAEGGPQISKQDWDFERVVMTTRELVKQYDIRWDREQVVPDDPQLADRVFEAGFALACKTGVYAIHTGRVIEFSPEELRTGMAEAPQLLVMGEGPDSRTLFAREIGDSRLPIVWAGNPGAPTPEEIFLPCVMSWMQEPIVDLVTCGSLTQVGGLTVVAGEATEILAARRELELLRQGLLLVNRPGMGLLAAQSAITEIGDLSVSQVDYLRPCDAHLVPLLNELVIDRVSMARAVNSTGYGMRNASLACVMVGGLGGGPAGSAVLQAASFILANLVCLADYHLLHPIHIRHVATSTREVMWVQSIVQQAFARNAPCIIVSDIYPKSGTGTKELLFEVAANAIAITASGGHLEGVGAADGALPNCSGLEARWMGEVGHVAAHQGVGLKEANFLVGKYLEKYEHVFSLPAGNPGVRFEKAYDLDSLQPMPAWQAMYESAQRFAHENGLGV